MQQLERIRQAAGDRFNALELSTTATVVMTDHPPATADRIALERGWSAVTAQQIMENAIDLCWLSTARSRALSRTPHNLSGAAEKPDRIFGAYPPHEAGFVGTPDAGHLRRAIPRKRGPPSKLLRSSLRVSRIRSLRC